MFTNDARHPRYGGVVRLLRWLGRTLERLDRSAERAALGPSVVQGEGTGGTTVNALGVKAVLGELERDADGEVRKR